MGNDTQLSNGFPAEHRLGRKAALQSMTQATRTQAQFPRPLRHGLGLSIVGQIDVLTRVPHLLRTGGPTAILGTIRPIVVNALNGMERRWPIPHVGQKLPELIPRRIDGYSPSSVVCVLRGVGVAAARVHPLPRKIRRIPASAQRGIALSTAQRRLLAPHLGTPQEERYAADRTDRRNCRSGTLLGHRSDSFGVAPRAVTSSAGVLRVSEFYQIPPGHGGFHHA